MLDDIARQYAAFDPDRLDEHPDRRHPHAELRRHVEIRDRTCVGVGCRHPARRCDLDHTHDHADGGTTTRDDLDPLCRHDHTLKHCAGWALHQPTPGRFVWTTGLGAVHHVRPEPVAPPLPDPVAQPDDPFHDQPAPEDDEPMRLHRPPPRPEPRPPPAPPTPAADDEPPPF